MVWHEILLKFYEYKKISENIECEVEIKVCYTTQYEFH